MSTSRSRRNVDLRQPFSVLCDDRSILRSLGQVSPFVRIIDHVVKLLATIGVTDVSPALAADGVIPLIVAGDGRSFPFHRRVPQLWDETDALQIISGCQTAKLDERGVDVEKLSRLRASLSRRDPWSGENEGDPRAPFP